MQDIFRKAISCLDPAGRRGLALLGLLMAAAGIAEVIGVGSIMPFLAVLANPALSESNPAIRALTRVSGIGGKTEIAMLLGGLALGAFITVNMLGLALAWATQRFTWSQGERIAARLFESHLAEPFPDFGRRHASERINLLFIETTRLAGNVFIPLLTIASRALAALLILAILVVIDPAAAAIAALVFAGVYGLLAVMTKGRAFAWSREALEKRRQATHLASEAFTSFRALRLAGNEAAHVAAFSRGWQRIGVLEARSQFIGAAPRYVLEIAAFGALFSAILWRLSRGEGVADILPAAGAYAFAGSRLLPALQQAYAAVTHIRIGAPGLDLIAAELAAARRIDTSPPPQWPGPGEVQLHNVSFAYPGADRNAIECVSLSISPCEAIGIIGRTGAGKSSLVDLIAGLIQPRSGRISVDGRILDAGSARSWRGAIGYVAQETVLSDDTIAANIAFGADAPDMERIKAAARAARVSEVIEQTMPLGYETRVGERGGALSGGQRQRIGIARALYRRPKLIILDEPTSALDEATEAEVIETLRGLAGGTTLVIVTHRPALLAVCGRVLEIDGGRASEALRQSSQHDVDTRRG